MRCAYRVTTPRWRNWHGVSPPPKACSKPSSLAELAAVVAHFKAGVVKLLDAADVLDTEFSAQAISAQLAELEDEYQRLKSQLLRSGTAGELPVRRIVAQLDLCSDMRRLAEQAEKGALYLDGLRVFATPPQEQAD